MENFLGVLLTIGVVVMFALFVKIMAYSGILGATVKYVVANNYSYCPVQDQLINKLVDEYDRGIITAKLGKHLVSFSNGEEVWIANYPYACYHLDGTSARVSAKTFRRFHKFLSHLACK